MINELGRYETEVRTALMFGNEYKSVDTDTIHSIITAPIGRFPLANNPNMEFEQVVVNTFSAIKATDNCRYDELSCLRMLRDINAELSHGIYEFGGVIRDYELVIDNYITLPVYSIDSINVELCLLRDISDSVKYALSYFCLISYKHPFYQNNVETAYIMLSALLHKSGYRFIASDQQIEEILQLLKHVWNYGKITDLLNYITVSNLVQK